MITKKSARIHVQRTLKEIGVNVTLRRLRRLCDELDKSDYFVGLYSNRKSYTENKKYYFVDGERRQKPDWLLTLPNKRVYTDKQFMIYCLIAHRLYTTGFSFRLNRLGEEIDKRQTGINSSYDNAFDADEQEFISVCVNSIDQLAKTPTQVLSNEASLKVVHTID